MQLGQGLKGPGGSGLTAQGRAGQTIRVADAASGLELPAGRTLQVDWTAGARRWLDGRWRGAVKTETLRSPLGASSRGPQSIRFPPVGIGSHEYTIVACVHYSQHARTRRRWQQLVRLSVAAVSSGQLQQTNTPVDTSALEIPVR